MGKILHRTYDFIEEMIYNEDELGSDVSGLESKKQSDSGVKIEFMDDDNDSFDGMFLHKT